MKKILIFVLVVPLVGCATGYHKYSWTGGYQDKAVGENLYELTYQGNGTTSHATVEQYWHMRAKELCKNGEYDFKFTDTKSNMAYSQYITVEHPKIVGTVTCK
jgi:hypothetical protein